VGATRNLCRLGSIAGRRGGAEKKLAEAARLWALGQLGKSDPTKPLGLDEEWRKDFADLGVTIEIDGDEEEAEDAFFVWDINWDSLLAFLACSTQWRLSAGFHNGRLVETIRHGLDYTAVRVVLDELHGNLKRHARRLMFEDIQAMESKALATFATTDGDD
jgi:hypothetical protein